MNKKTVCIMLLMVLLLPLLCLSGCTQPPEDVDPTEVAGQLPGDGLHISEYETFPYPEEAQGSDEVVFRNLEEEDQIVPQSDADYDIVVSKPTEEPGPEDGLQIGDEDVTFDWEDWKKED